MADRLLLGVGCGRLGDLLQRGVERRRLSTQYGRRGRVDRQDREVLRLDYIGSKGMARRMTFLSSRTFPDQR